MQVKRGVSQAHSDLTSSKRNKTKKEKFFTTVTTKLKKHKKKGTAGDKPENGDKLMMALKNKCL